MRASLTAAALIVGIAGCGGGSDTPEDLQALEGALGGFAAIGTGVTVVDTGNPLGRNVFIAYAGWNISQGQAEAWASALYDARLRELGVRHVFAVKGPADSAYNGLEIGNSKIAAQLNQLVTADTGFVLVAGHSSGSFVADELLQQLDTGADPSGTIGSKLVYFALDGDQKYVAASGINRLRHAYYVNAFSNAAGLWSPNAGAMNALGGAYAGKGGVLHYDASSSGCSGQWCVHISLVNTRPHDPSNGSGIDYADFGGRPVNPWWLDAKAAEAQLGQCDGAFSTKGAIEGAYIALGGCSSLLGAPTTDELTTPDGAGRYNHFQNGSIYWTFFTGAHEVHGAIRALWSSLGWERSALGYPISDTHDVMGRRQSDFQHGAIALRADGTAYVVVPAPPDAGSPVDAGTVVDAGLALDAGSAGDAGLGLDAGSEADAGPAPDAGATLPLPVRPGDAGTWSPSGPVVAELGDVSGGCSEAGGNLGGLLGALLVLGWKRRAGRRDFSRS